MQLEGHRGVLQAVKAHGYCNEGRWSCRKGFRTDKRAWPCDAEGVLFDERSSMRF
jgi:hypothetical protein